LFCTQTAVLNHLRLLPTPKLLNIKLFNFLGVLNHQGDNSALFHFPGFGFLSKVLVTQPTLAVIGWTWKDANHSLVPAEH